MALAFIGPCPKGHLVDHIDQNKLNNHISNLRYATYSDNGKNVTLKPKVNYNQSFAIDQYELDGTYIRTWNSIQSVIDAMKDNCKANMFNYTSFSQYGIQGEQPYHGFLWKIADKKTIIEGEIWKPFELSDLTIYVPLNNKDPNCEVSDDVDIDMNMDDIETYSPVLGQVYMASNMGRIQLLNGSQSHGHRSQSKYMYVKISGKKIQVGRIICEVFHGKPPSADCISDHINEDRSDNRAENLQWLTMAENTRKSVCRVVEYVDLPKDSIMEYSSVTQASDETGQSAHTIASKCRGIMKQDASCFWRYKLTDQKSQNVTARAINKLALNGTLIATFPSINEAVRDYHQNTNQEVSGGIIHASRIVECCKGQRESTGGFRWEYVTRIVKFTPVDPSKRVQQYSIHGVHIKDFDDTDQAATELKIPYVNITKCCKLQQRSTNGFIFKYGTDSRPVISLSVNIYYGHYKPDGTLIKRYTSSSVANRDLKVSINHITNYSLGNKKTPDGTIWKREIIDSQTGNYTVI